MTIYYGSFAAETQQATYRRILFPLGKLLRRVSRTWISTATELIYLVAIILRRPSTAMEFTLLPPGRHPSLLLAVLPV